MANMLSWLTGREDKTGQPPLFAVDDGQPSLRAYNPTPTERVGNWIQDLLMAGGAQAYPAGHVAHGVRDLLSMSPLGIGMSAADLLHAKNANDPMGAAAAAIGMVPGLKPEAAAVRQGIRAFHGSPHDFDKFDISRIGSGEGAQAFGHGLYFAENEGVARAYRDNLIRNTKPMPNTPNRLVGMIRMGETDPEKILLKINDMRDFVAKDRARYRQPDRWGAWDSALEKVTTVDAVKDAIQAGKGRMYEVNINAKPEQFLDWDRSLRDQPQAVQDLTKDLFARRFPNADPFSAENAGSAYKKLENFGTGRSVSQEFGEAGIPGIRYLDQGSRNVAPARPDFNVQWSEKTGTYHLIDPATGQSTAQYPNLSAATKAARQPEKQTSNYVLFNDQLVDIMRKYGLAAPAAAGAASYAMAPQEAQAAKAQPAQFQQAAPLSDRINQIIDSLQWQDQWQGRMRLPLERKVNNMLGESVWPPLR